MPHDAAIFAGLFVNTDLAGRSDLSAFEPTRIWARAFGWIKGIRGWEATTVPPGWM